MSPSGFTVAKPSVDHVPACGFVLSVIEKKMVWFPAVITVVVVMCGFLYFYKRRLDVLTGPWISRTNLKVAGLEGSHEKTAHECP